MDKYITLIYWIYWCLIHPKKYKKNGWTLKSLFIMWKVYFQKMEV